jgi:hypothetical protein
MRHAVVVVAQNFEIPISFAAERAIMQVVDLEALGLLTALAANPVFAAKPRHL